MESKLRGLTPESTRIDSLLWVRQARAQYTEVVANGLAHTETNFARGNDVIRLLDKTLPLPHPPSVLLVGLGLDTKPILQCSEPHRVAAHLQGKNIDYQMTLVDVSTDVVEDVRKRKALYLSYRQYGSSADGILENWDKYLTDTSQPGRETFEFEPDLRFYEYLLKPEGMFNASEYLKLGILAADVSPQFSAKLTDGSISIRQEDIADADLNKSAPFDVVDLRNVLYLINPEGQKSAIANIAGHMRKGGLIAMNDIGGYSGYPVFPRQGGWMTENHLQDLSLVVDEVTDRERSSESFVLRKE